MARKKVKINPKRIKKVDKSICTKKKFNNFSEALGLIKKASSSSKRPDRTEATAYRCDKCGSVHVSSISGKGSITIAKYRDKSYIELETEKWKKFISKHSANKGRF